MDTRASTATRLSILPIFIALLMNLVIGPLAPVITGLGGSARAAATVELEDGIEGCMGVRTTPGSENTTKQLTGGTLEPGGTAEFTFTFPAEVDGNPGQEEWQLTDCVFLNGEPFQKYTVTALENDTSPVVITFTLTIPVTAPIGGEYCNFAKTTETPSDPQASNRKAGPACFIIGGALRVLKVNESQTALPGATFTVACEWPDVSTGTVLPQTVLSVPTDGTINGGASTETITSTDDGSFTRTVVTGSQGVISVNGPNGTVCAFTETQAPAGYVAPEPPDNSVTLTINVTAGQVTHTFVNTLPPGHLEVVKNLEPSDDPGRFDLQIDGVTLKDEAADEDSTGEQELAADTYTVGETADGETSLSNYTSSISCIDTANGNAAVTATPVSATSWDVTVTNGSDIVCRITNARQTGNLEVVKNLEPSDDAGRFDLQIEGVTLKDEAADEDSTGEQTVNTGVYTVGETADGETSLADYASSVSCVDTANDNANVTATPVSATSWDVTVTNGSDIVCRITNSRDTGNLTVIKDLNPSTDPGRFDLLIDSVVRADEVGDEGTTGAVEVNTGPHTVGEAAGANTNLADYQTGISCVDGTTPVTATPGSGTTWSVDVTDDADVVCTISNTRETGTLEVVKDLSPSTDPGKFNLQIDGSTAGSGANVGDNGTTGEMSVNTGSHTVGETAGTSTSLGNYSSEIECRGSDGTGAIVVAGSGSGPLPVPVGFGDDIVCVISNTRVTVGFDKANDQGDNAAVAPGETIHYTLTVTVNEGTATNVVVTDDLPAGLTYETGTADPSTGFSVSANGRELTWTVAALSDGTHTFEYDATVDANASGVLTNLGCVDVDQNDALVCDQTTVRVPTLVVDKVASTETIVISGPNDALVATPSVVTWTLSYTLANGPVTNAVITDAVPTGFTFLDASNGGTFANGTITWNLGTLTSSGSVTFRTTVDPATISRVAPTVNIATIDSNDTAPDSGQDSVTVSVQPPVLAGNPTPTPTPEAALPNTATGIGLDGTPFTVPLELLVAFFIGSLGALALANVKARSRRR